jgi:hypothetical protein
MALSVVLGSVVFTLIPNCVGILGCSRTLIRRYGVTAHNAHAQSPICKPFELSNNHLVSLRTHRYHNIKYAVWPAHTLFTGGRACAFWRTLKDDGRNSGEGDVMCNYSDRHEDW